MGTAIEIYVAAKAGAAVLAVSPMRANWVLLTYCDAVFDDFAGLDAYLADGELDRLMERKKRS